EGAHNKFAVAAVVREARDGRTRDACEELAAPARVATPAIAAVPPDADALADAPPLDVVPDRVDPSDYLVPRHARQRHAGIGGGPGERVAVADPARLDRDAHGMAGGGGGGARGGARGGG